MAMRFALAGAAACIVSGLSAVIVAYLFWSSPKEGHECITRQEQSLLNKATEARAATI